MSNEQGFDGAVIEGGGGELYLIPSTDLAKYRVSPSRAEAMKSELEADSDTSGFSMAGTGEMLGGIAFPNIRPLKALETTIAPKSVGSGWYVQEGQA